MIKKILGVILIHITIMSYAQEGTFSPYSFHGIGISKFKGTVENRSMGGLSIYTDSIHVNLQNPAAYSELRLTTYTIGTSYSRFETQNTTKSYFGESTSLDYLSVGIPIGNRFGLGFGVVPITSVGYRIQTIQDDKEFQFTGIGGMNKVFLTFGGKITKNFSVGAEASYNFGNIENKSIYKRTTVQFDTREIKNSDLSGFGMSFGATYKGMITKKLQLTTSVVANPSFDLNAEETTELASLVIGNDDKEVIVDDLDVGTKEKNIEIPTEVRVGTGIGEPRKWFAGVEYAYLDAKKFDGIASTQGNIEYSSATKYKLGGYFIPKYNSLTSYFSRVVYRVGFRYEETGLSIDGNAIEEFGMSFGVGLPVGRLFSNANLGFEYIQRGKTDFGLIKEEFFNFSLSLSLNDKWFRKIKFN